MLRITDRDREVQWNRFRLSISADGLELLSKIYLQLLDEKLKLTSVIQKDK